uniref:Uncharacterized protein n=1 Tax=Siphoviridae sp. ctXZx16 TaxID=2826371 RepID=A0A8S5ML21_9CAUD|nr:MAG TPA: hypothetical protein [Siphoviridae sp. ctXZx16]
MRLRLEILQQSRPNEKRITKHREIDNLKN